MPRPLNWATALLVVVVGFAAVRHRIAVQDLEAGRRAEAESFARILQGLSRSISPDAIVGAIVEELGAATGADHVVIVRRRPDARVLEATLVNARTGGSTSSTLFPIGDLEEPVARRWRAGRARPGRDPDRGRRTPPIPARRPTTVRRRLRRRRRGRPVPAAQRTADACDGAGRDARRRDPRVGDPRLRPRLRQRPAGHRGSARPVSRPRPRSPRREPDRRPGAGRLRPPPHARRAPDERRRDDRRAADLAPDRRSTWPPAAQRLLVGAAVEASAALSRAYSHRQAEARASTDGLTGLPNRRYFDEFCALLSRRRRAEDSVGVLMVDIDKFKVLNDTHGHQVGDEVLRAVAGAIVGAVREDDVPARYGGEEFAVLLRNPTLEVARRGRRARPRGRRRARSRPVRCRRRSGCRSARRWPRTRTSRSRRRSSRPTGRSTTPSGAAATGWSPPDVAPEPAAAPALPSRPCPESAPRAAPRRRRSASGRRATLTRSRRRPRPGHHDPADHDPDEPPADVLADEAADLTNGDLARIFHEIGDILEVQGEIAFKTIAYHRAADTIGRSPIDLVAAYRAGEPPKVAGVGQAISDKISELVTTGRMAYLERLRSEVPASLVELLQIPGLGPKTVRQLHEELGIATMDRAPEAAAEAGRIRTVRGLSERTEQLILEGIAPARDRSRRAGCTSTRPRSTSRPSSRSSARCPASARSSRPARTAAGRRRSATSTCSPRRPIRRR